MERRGGQQRLKINERQGRTAHAHGHGRQVLSRLYRAPDHLDNALALQGQGPSRRQVHALHQHHRQTGQRLRQQIPRVNEGGEAVPVFAHRQAYLPQASPLVPPVDEIPDGANGPRQQAQAVDGDPEGHGAQEHPAGPGTVFAQGQQQQYAPQQQGRCEQREERPKVLLAAQEQGCPQQTPHPPQGTQQPRPPAQGHEVPQGPQQRRTRCPGRADRHPAQGFCQPDEEPVRSEVVQQKPFERDPHATSTTMTVMSSR